MVPTTSLQASVQAHDSFFARIIDMIPAELYTHSVSEASDEINSKYYKHRKLPLTADERKSISKKMVSEKYSDEAATSTIDKRFENQPDGSSASDSVEGAPPALTTAGLSNDMDILRERLQQRILGLKSSRTSDKPFKMLRAEKAARDKKSKQPVQKPNQKKRQSTSNGSSEQTSGGTSVDNSTDNSSGDSDKKSSAASSVLPPSSTDVQFSKLLVISKEESGGGYHNAKTPAPGSKMQRLQRLLEESDRKRTRLAALAQSGEIGAKKVENEKWNDALKTAAGEKTIVVNSSTKTSTEQKIRKAIKRKEAVKRKSAEKWKERLDTNEAAKSAKIEKRESNLLKRKNHGVEPAKEEEKEGGTQATKKHRNNPYSEYFKKNNKPTEESNTAADSKGAKGNRAGFEGKKQMGDFLNKKKSDSKR